RDGNAAPAHVPGQYGSTTWKAGAVRHNSSWLGDVFQSEVSNCFSILHGSVLAKRVVDLPGVEPGSDIGFRSSCYRRSRYPLRVRVLQDWETGYRPTTGF